MPPDILTRKALSLVRCLDRIALKAPPSANALKADLDAQDIISINLQRAVQLCVDIAAHVLAEVGAAVPVRMRDAFQGLADRSIISARTAEVMQKAVGFRNRAVHQYDEIDWGVVHDIVTRRLVDLKSFVKELAAAGHLKAPVRKSPSAPAKTRTRKPRS